MIYLIFGNDRFVMEKTINKEITKVLGEPDALNLVKLDFREVTFSDILIELDYLPLGIDKKVVLVDYVTIFEKKNTLSSKDEEVLKSFILSRKDDILLCFVVRGTIPKKNPIVDLIEKHGRIIEIQDISKNDWPRLVSSIFKKNDVAIDDDARDLLLEYTQSNTMNLYQEVEKLSLYKSHITKKDIVDLVARPFEESVFELANALIRNDKAQALQIYRDFLVLNIEPLTFIINLANQFRLYAMVYILNSQNLSKDEIATNLSIHPYRVQLALQMRTKLKLEDIYQLIEKLHDLDYKIKSGQIDRFYAFELFIINY